MLYLNYNYSNAKLAKKAINCVKRYNITSEKALRVKDIIEISCPKLYNKLSRGDKCRIGRAVSIMYNQRMHHILPEEIKKVLQIHIIAKLYPIYFLICKIYN